MVEATQKPIADLMAAIEVKDKSLRKLRELADGCPVCILAALRQSKVQRWDGDPESVPPSFDFNFKAECKAIFARINEAAESEHG